MSAAGRQGQLCTCAEIVRGGHDPDFTIGGRPRVHHPDCPSYAVFRPLSGKGLLLTCSFCGREQRLDTGAMYPDRHHAEFYLRLMTGGHHGSGLLDFEEAGAESTIGKSACCGTQVDGELYGYEET